MIATESMRTFHYLCLIKHKLLSFCFGGVHKLPTVLIWDSEEKEAFLFFRFFSFTFCSFCFEDMLILHGPSFNSFFLNKNFLQNNNYKLSAISVRSRK